MTPILRVIRNFVHAFYNVRDSGALRPDASHRQSFHSCIDTRVTVCRISTSTCVGTARIVPFHGHLVRPRSPFQPSFHLTLLPSPATWAACTPRPGLSTTWRSCEHRRDTQRDSKPPVVRLCHEPHVSMRNPSTWPTKPVNRCAVQRRMSLFNDQPEEQAYLYNGSFRLRGSSA